MLKNVLFFISGIAVATLIWSMWALISAKKCKEKTGIELYGEICKRIQKQLDFTRFRVRSMRYMLLSADTSLDQAILTWKYEYLIQQEKWLMELICGKMEELNVQQMPKVWKEADRPREH